MNTPLEYILVGIVALAILVYLFIALLGSTALTGEKARQA